MKLIIYSLFFAIFFAGNCFAWVPPHTPKAKVKKRTARPATKRPGKVGAKAKPGPKAVEVKINPKDGAAMVWVPAGAFLMGSSDEDIAAMREEIKILERKESGSRPDLVIGAICASNEEKPQHTVYLDGYWIYKYEVTVAQYRKFCKETGRKMPDPPYVGWFDIYPIENVNWQDAADYTKWAGMSLPTEAQWEKAARGMDRRIYPWGNLWDPSKCANGAEFKITGRQGVGSYPSGESPYGAMDMAGNVWEWCADWYSMNYYEHAPARNPTGPASGSTRVLRGGSWYLKYGQYFRCAHRNFAEPGFIENYPGFRCVGNL
jgi:formylglycine-generating enzyme